MRISKYPLISTPLDGTEELLVNKDGITKKTTVSNVIGIIPNNGGVITPSVDTNFATNDLVATNNRVHDFSGYDLTIKKLNNLSFLGNTEIVSIVGAIIIAEFNVQLLIRLDRTQYPDILTNFTATFNGNGYAGPYDNRVLVCDIFDSITSIDYYYYQPAGLAPGTYVVSDMKATIQHPIQYSLDVPTIDISAQNLEVLAFENGLGKKVNLGNAILSSSQNFANADLVATDNREHDFAGYGMIIDNLSQLYFRSPGIKGINVIGTLGQTGSYFSFSVNVSQNPTISKLFPINLTGYIQGSPSSYSATYSDADSNTQTYVFITILFYGVFFSVDNVSQNQTINLDCEVDLPKPYTGGTEHLFAFDGSEKAFKLRLDQVGLDLQGTTGKGNITTNPIISTAQYGFTVETIANVGFVGRLAAEYNHYPFDNNTYLVLSRLAQFDGTFVNSVSKIIPSKILNTVEKLIVLELPNESGLLALSVNGIIADSTGNIILPAADLQSVLTEGNRADISILIIGDNKEITTQQQIGGAFFGASLKNDTINGTGFLQLAKTFSSGRSGYRSGIFKLVKNDYVDVVISTPSKSGTMALIEDLSVIFDSQEIKTNDLFFNLKPIYRILIAVPPSTIINEAFFAGGLPGGIETIIQAKHTVSIQDLNSVKIEFGAPLNNDNTGGSIAVPIRATITDKGLVILRTTAAFIGRQVVSGHIIVEYTKV